MLMKFILQLKKSLNFRNFNMKYKIGSLWFQSWEICGAWKKMTKLFCLFCTNGNCLCKRLKICQCSQVRRMTTIRSSQEIYFTEEEKNNSTITLLCGRTKPCCLPWQTFKIMNKIKGSFSVFFLQRAWRSIFLIARIEKKNTTECQAIPGKRGGVKETKLVQFKIRMWLTFHFFIFFNSS